MARYQATAAPQSWPATCALARPKWSSTAAMSATEFDSE